MNRLIAIFAILVLLSSPAWAQEVEDESAEAVPAAEESAEEAPAAEEDLVVEAEEEPEDEEPEFDETGLDEQGYSDEDDDFAPSEDIPADQSIDFPADI